MPSRRNVRIASLPQQPPNHLVLRVALGLAVVRFVLHIDHTNPQEIRVLRGGGRTVILLAAPIVIHRGPAGARGEGVSEGKCRPRCRCLWLPPSAVLSWNAVRDCAALKRFTLARFRGGRVGARWRAWRSLIASHSAEQSRARTPAARGGRHGQSGCGCDFLAGIRLPRARLWRTGGGGSDGATLSRHGNPAASQSQETERMVRGCAAPGLRDEAPHPDGTC